MIEYQVYSRNNGEKQYKISSYLIKIHEPLEIGKFTTYKQFGLTRAKIDKIEFKNIYKVYLTIFS